MLKLVVVVCGDNQRLTEYVHILQKGLYDFAKQYDFLLYNTNNIYSAEGNFDALKKNSRFYFSSKKDTIVEYWGIIASKNLRTYYSRWFEDKADDALFNKTMTYNKDNLSSLLNKWINNSINPKNSNLFDFRIKYQYSKEEDKDVCLVEFSLNSSELYPAPKDVFRNIIVKIDKLFSDVFISAYVTDEQIDIGDAHYQIYHYNINLLDSKILDVGYMVYVSKNIEKANSFDINVALSQYIINSLSNGALYEHKGTIDKLEDSNKVDDLLFNELIIPRYRVFNWSDICKRKCFSISVCELVSIYYDAYSPNDPTIVFSYGYNHNELDNLPMLFDMRFRERHNVKELIGDTV